MKRFYQIALVIVALSCVGAMSYLPHRRAAFRGGGAFTYYSAIFDGSNDYLTRGAALSNVSTGKTGTISYWVKRYNEDSCFLVRQDTSSRGISAEFNGVNIRIRCRDASFTYNMQLNSTGISVESNAWHHIMASWDVSAGVNHLYYDGVDVEGTSSTSDSDIPYPVTQFAIGSNLSGTPALFAGVLSEFYFSTNYIDLSSSANRDKFFNSTTSKPVDLGSDGSNPDGLQPAVYLKLEVPDWESNQGFGGGFTETGALGDGGADIP